VNKQNQKFVQMIEKMDKFITFCTNIIGKIDNLIDNKQEKTNNILIEKKEKSEK
jgi:hypothetical protein